MGLFSVRCAVTGVALSVGPCCLVVLRRSSDSLVPVSLPVWGDYDGYGGIEAVEESSTLGMLLRGLEGLRSAGRLAVNQRLAQLPQSFGKPDDFFSLLFSGGAGLSCEGDPLAHQLIYAPVARVSMARSTGFGRGLRIDLEPARSAFSRAAGSMGDELEAFARLDGMVTARGGWLSQEGGHFTIAQVRSYFSDACAEYSADPEMLAALRAYAGDHFDEGCDAFDRWVELRALPRA